MSRNLGPGPIHRSETSSSAAPLAASSGRHFGVSHYIRPLAGLGLVIALVVIVFFAISLFGGRFTETVAVTVISDRAGLVMNPDAKVKMHGAQVGTVKAIDYRADGTAVLTLAMNPDMLQDIPSNTQVDIASSTVFGAKFVQLKAPDEVTDFEPMTAGQVITAERVTVEVNTVFERLRSVLSTIQPDKLNKILSALSSGLDGRGATMGRGLSDLNQLLAQLDPSLPNLARDIETAPEVFDAFADAAPNLLVVAQNASTMSQTLVTEQDALDQMLTSVIGLADTGEPVLVDNRVALVDTLRLLNPITGLTNKYNEALNCALTTQLVNSKIPPLKNAGAEVLTSFSFGVERYRYPGDLPKVAATGGSQCGGLPVLPKESRLPWLVADTGANPWKYGNSGIVLNAAGLKEMLFGHIDGPPRNSAQIGQPG
ncbi:MCE family protein [Mycobacterium sp. 236(2023)]|uniref:MCE family protein n=1 Tax=Mycobacterium sp. 236(2023) TaxID=3038163 RepID=UPI002414E46E|nr:MCE family protein [Mycobacterium sp. 236(2023)]MDG4668177.1 MCE family protein [Mycobacterium sp. 236(2023)]